MRYNKQDYSSYREQIRYFFYLSRPRFWIYLFGPFLIGAIASVQGPFFFSLYFFVFGLYFLFPANFFLYAINDAFDYETDKMNPKKKGYEQIVTPLQRKNVCIAATLVMLPFLIYGFYSSFIVGCILLAFLFLSWQYSAPPIRAKARPFLDMAFNSLYILPGLLAYFLWTETFPPLGIFLAGICWTMAMHAYSAVPDIDSDKKAGLATIATVLGYDRTLLLCLFLYVISSIVATKYLGFMSLMLGGVYVTLMTLSLLTKQEYIFIYYKKFPLINTIMGGLLFLFILLSK